VSRQEVQPHELLVVQVLGELDARRSGGDDHALDRLGRPAGLQHLGVPALQRV
jgi:hypothetical protein